MRTIIAGSRDGVTAEAINTAIELSKFNITSVVCGRARGADQLGEEWAIENCIPVDPYPAQWIVDGVLDRGAGYKRNIIMAENADQLILVWDGVSRGSRHMRGIAQKLQLTIFVYLI